MQRILVVDDDPALRRSLERVLRLASYDVTLADEGQRALALLGGDRYSAVVLDVTMPAPDGLEVCRRLRAGGDRTPVIMLTSREAVSDRVDGLEAGADDYLVKPFAIEELLARLRALLRRTGTSAADRALTFTDLTLVPSTREVRRGQHRLDLRPTEFSLLETLLSNAGRVMTRSVIYEAVWGYDFGRASKTLEVYIGYLRRKTEIDGAPRLIHTVRDIGYVLREP
ncbi:MAG: response regulator transcription factor [Candidatus Limnocylindria bacterium]